MNIFEQAARSKLRFASTRGEITLEHLWDLPLVAKHEYSLDNVARTIAKSLKEIGEESFVAVSTNPEKAILELKLEIVKHIISTKQAEAQANNAAASRQAERKRLLEALDKRVGDELSQLSSDELRKRLDDLDKV